MPNLKLRIAPDFAPRSLYRSVPGFPLYMGANGTIRLYDSILYKSFVFIE